MSLEDLGWDEDWAQALTSLPGHAAARVTAVHRGRVQLHDGTLMPTAGSAGDQPATGDWIAHRDGAVRAILPRRTTLGREDGVLVANADLAVIVTSLNHDLNLRRIERFAALARGGGVEPLIVLSKGDLHDDPVTAAAHVAAELHAEVLVVSVHQGWGIPALRQRFTPRSTAVLMGMSGVGKSTLVNHLLGEEVQHTLEVRARDDRGRHATTHRELFVLDNGGLLIDTPGVRRPGLATDEGVAEAFSDVAELAQACRFGDCRHETEPGCAVRDRVSPERLASMRKLEREGWSAAQRKARDRQTGRIGREAMRLKGR